MGNNQFAKLTTGHTRLAVGINPIRDNRSSTNAPLADL